MNFKSPLRFYLLFLFSLSIISCQSRKQELVVNGVLDFSNFKIESSQILDLKGGWVFYWNQVPLNNKGEFDLSKLKKRESISIDNGSWQENGNPAKGYGTFYLKVLLPKDSICRQLKITRIQSSAQVWVNGKRQDGLGKFSSEEEYAVADGRPLYIDIGCGGESNIILTVSNYHHIKGGGFPYGAYVSSKERMKNQRDLLFLVQSSVAIIIFLIACYHIFLFFNNRSKLLLFFALFTIFSIVRQFFIGEATIYTIFPNIKFSVVQLFRYVPLYLGISFFIIYFSHLALKKQFYWIARAIVISYALCLIFVMIVSTYNSTYVSMVNPFLAIVSFGYVFYLVIDSFIKKEANRRMLLLNALLAIIYLSNDLFFEQKFINTDFLQIVALLCFLLLQVVISYRYWMDNLLRIQRLSYEVSELNETIEIGKEERALLLSESIQQLQSKQQLAKKLVDIKNSTSEASLTGIIAELKSKKLEESTKIILKQNIEELNFEFLRKLKGMYKNLTTTDIEICSLIRLGFSSEEICNLRSTTKFALKSTRYRIRKKMKLPSDTSLKEYLQNF